MKPFYYSTRSPVYNKPFIFEKWVAITDSIVRGADGSILVSNTGKFFDNVSKQYITPIIREFYDINRKQAYVNIPTVIDGYKKYKSIDCHILVMRSFYPNDNPEMEINHINGDTLRNDVYNLSWCTNFENLRFAYMNGQMTYRDKDGNINVKHILDPDTLDTICKLIREGKTYNEISKITGVSYQKIFSIHHKRTYQDYYNKYNLQEIPYPKENNTIPDDILFSIANRIMEGIPDRKIAEEFGCSPSTIKSIKNREVYFDKLKEYNFESVRKNPSKEYLTEEKKEQFFKFINDNKDKYKRKGLLYRDGIRSLGINTPNRLYPSMRGYINRILSE